MHDDGYAYGSWGLVITMIVVSLFFVFKFIPMRTRLGKRSGGALIAFIVALFAEMYGFPLTIYMLGHFVGIEIPFDHISGHLLGDLISALGLGNGWAIVMIGSNVLIIAGIWMVATGWEKVYGSQGTLVTDGIYRYIRHPQYTGIFVITLGFMIQWPTLATLLLWPFVIWMYVRLAKREEDDVLKQHPEEYLAYMGRTPRFVPHILARSRQPSQGPMALLAVAFAVLGWPGTPIRSDLDSAVRVATVDADTQLNTLHGAQQGPTTTKGPDHGN